MSNSPYLSTLKPILRRMKTIKFSDEEISLLRNMYEDELAQAKNHIDRIKDTLKKLGAPAKASDEISIDKEPKVKKRRGRKSKKSKTLEPKVPKKRGRPKKIVVPTIEAATVKIAKPAKKAKSKKKVAAKPKVKVKKRSIAKATPKKNTAEKSDIVPTGAPTSKVIKKVAKKKVTRKRKGLSLVNLRKPLVKKEPVIESEPRPEPVPAIEPVIAPTEEPKE